jgi:hypothetical protein
MPILNAPTGFGIISRFNTTIKKNRNQEDARPGLGTNAVRRAEPKDPGGLEPLNNYGRRRVKSVAYGVRNAYICLIV